MTNLLAYSRLRCAVPILCLLSVAAAAQQASSDPDAPVVTTRDGTLRGQMLPGGVRAFRGIPYAKPPLGTLRWKPPVPPTPWKGVRDAVRFGNRPMQNRVYSDMVFRSDTISEDCLYLNVCNCCRHYNCLLLSATFHRFTLRFKALNFFLL